MSPELLILVILSGAFLSPFLSKLLRIPLPVGELIFGLLLGYLIGSSEKLPQVINFLAHFGFLILMFLAGLEVDFNLLERLPGRYYLTYTLYILGVVFSSLSLSLLLGYGLGFGVLLSLISVGLLLPILRASSDKNFSQKALVIGAMGELASLFLLTFIHKFSHFSGYTELILESIKSLGFFLGFFTFFLSVKLLIWWFPEIVKAVIYEKDVGALSIRLSLFLIFSGAILSKLVGFEDVLGAFLVGILVSYFIREKHELEEKITSLGYGFLIPVFFIKTGMSLDFSALKPESVLTILSLSFLLLFVRALPAPLLLIGGFTLKQTLRLPLLLSFPFTLLIAGIEIAHKNKLISETQALELYLTAVFTSLFFPWLSKVFIK